MILIFTNLAIKLEIAKISTRINYLIQSVCVSSHVCKDPLNLSQIVISFIDAIINGRLKVTNYILKYLVLFHELSHTIDNRSSVVGDLEEGKRFGVNLVLKKTLPGKNYKYKKYNSDLKNYD